MSTNTGGITGRIEDAARRLDVERSMLPSGPPRDPMLDFLMMPSGTSDFPGLSEAVLAAVHTAPPVFEEFPKIPRLRRECIITEKIDGMNAQIFIGPRTAGFTIPPAIAVSQDLFMYVGTRSGWVNPNNDVCGFAKWATENAEELFNLGPGTHRGEWWGSGVRRSYGLTKGDKRFSLFNTSRWTEDNTPKCVGVVPIVYQGLFSTTAVDDAVEELRKNGSVVSDGFMKPEGVVVFHIAANVFFKVTLDKDEAPKSVVAAA